MGAAPTARPVLKLAISESSPRAFVLPLLRPIAEGGGFEWVLHLLPWARLLALSARGEMLAFGLSRNPQREQQYLFSEPVFTNHVWMVVRAGESPEFGGLDSLRGRTLCLTRGISDGTVFDQARERRLFETQQVGLDLVGRRSSFTTACQALFSALCTRAAMRGVMPVGTSSTSGWARPKTRNSSSAKPWPISSMPSKLISACRNIGSRATTRRAWARESSTWPGPASRRRLTVVRSNSMPLPSRLQAPSTWSRVRVVSSAIAI
ncbi:transporter substrate-binding domain-containing protein [Roseateles sp. DAIF2]|nr:transporter substrate-binding domain-containing protein [Roseateles sp. DAIF2]